ncbi:hypothetical protein COPG_00136 [Colwellia phage 9A]|uniref:Uncharacterized protein n=1 Tax=Colwellia phage 9A TaxID=765765 RepID=I3UML7_9CAUD|nr:hypothetical protein COPG_00136 [Colwellia phage 9A]AFK66732.1 hypothetical protein COPG_00136 [Colwellia phage 9A]
MNITAIKSALSNQVTVDKLRQAIHNTSKLGFSTDHVSNRKGKNFLAVRCRGGVLSIHDKDYKEVTQLVVKVCRDLIAVKEAKQALLNADINQGDTFYYNDELYYNKYQVINKNFDNPSFVCENVLIPEDQEVLTKRKINELINK